ncbi:MAG: DUF839 domain-containing protein [Caulobacteraceae bacterium]|nr:DUF839 domain-containing protein [Caulobacteraceae bacterium]
MLLSCAPVAAWAGDGIGPFTSGVPAPQPAVGAPPNVLSSDFTATVVAIGTDPLENPSGLITTYGKLSNGVQTEPDQNTYVNLPGLVKGPTPKYYYGHNFLFQAHEASGGLGYVTRINLDVTDPAHRITLLTPVGDDQLTHLSRGDGSTYDPFTKSLLATQEGGPTDGGVIEISLGSWPPVVTTHYGSMGRCGLEGVHLDDQGRIYLVEDTGGISTSNDPNDPNGPVKVARQPNSYVYRFIPKKPTDLSAGGKLQALQVFVDGAPLVFGGTAPDQVFADVYSPKQLELHSGASFPTRWITIHNTAKDGAADFDCNATARAAGATPFKRPENGTFKPDGKFRTFYFTPTGDTNSLSGSVPALAARGAWGGIFELHMDALREDGKIKLIVLGDADHNSFDNITFGDSNTILAAEDRGDTLHDQLNALDSIWAYPLTALASPLRVLAQGRDASASGAGAEDNEPTGIHVSNGGIARPIQYGTTYNLPEARGFYTQQHGDNTTFELHHN